MSTFTTDPTPGGTGIQADCQLPHDVPTPATHDAKTTMGPWAYVCDAHLRSHTVSGQTGPLATRL